MFDEIMERIESLGAIIRGEVAEEIKSEIHAATIKHMATMLFLARTGSGGEGDANQRREREIEHCGRIALEIDAAVEELLDSDEPTVM